VAGCAGQSSSAKPAPAPSQNSAASGGPAGSASPSQRIWPGAPQKDGLVFHGSRATKMVALTFDADMTPQMWHNLDTGKTKSAYEKRIIETLRATHTPATIFATGMWIERYPADTRELAADPLLEFGNHTYKHYALKEPCYGLPSLPVSQIYDDAERTAKLLDRYAPGHTSYFRFPGGCYNAAAIQALAPTKLLPIQWDVISGDAYLHDPKKIAETSVSEATGGSIIIMHLNGAPNAPATYAALPDIIKGLHAKGLTPVKLSTLLAAP
jgi:peptidoglycan/xylan/chitin deacetylase (PgdA/CDA1 family)